MRKIFSGVIICGIFLLACDNKIFSTPIDKILKNPRNYDDKVVRVNGEVTKSINLLLMKYFVVKDKTGEISVVTNRILPKQGDSVSVTGHVQEGFTIGPNQLVVIVEETGNKQKPK